MIPVQNIYYMLAYAFRALNEKGYGKLKTEKFENAAELFSAIIISGMNKQIKQGLLKEYAEYTEVLSVLHGKIDINESIKTGSINNKKLVCNYDELTINSYQNKIIKSTTLLLLKSDISHKRKTELRKICVLLNDIEVLEVNRINWEFNFNKNNRTYQMLLGICYLVVKEHINNKEKGIKKLMDFSDEQRESRLFEKFVLEYYRKEFTKIDVNASFVSWELDNDFSYLLPAMKSDVTLVYNNKVLIIDTKYYRKNLQSNFDKMTIHSNNLYQMFTYVKNKSVSNADVSGLILYAKTDDEIQPDSDYLMSGNKISVKNLDLNCDFESIKKQLDEIVEKAFGDVKKG